LAREGLAHRGQQVGATTLRAFNDTEDEMIRFLVRLLVLSGIFAVLTKRRQETRNQRDGTTV